MKALQYLHGKWKQDHAEDVLTWPKATRQCFKRKFYDAISE
jgi:hypothetical protein